MNSDSDKYYEMHESYSKTLRAWLVAYGVGGPIIFLTQKDVAKSISSSEDALLITCLFFGGVILQIFVTALNKWINWYLHLFTADPDWVETKGLRIIKWIKGIAIVDILCDVGAITLFMWATLEVLLIFGTAGNAS